MPINLPKNINFVLKTLQKAGFEAYIVGGCVRDALMGIPPHDYDITTSATPDEVKVLFCHTVDTGIKHGTVTVIEDGEPIEVTTFRTESGYSDSRHPDNVLFVRDLKSDLSRRDFTVNAICFNPDIGIIDPFKGKIDISSKILRTVGEPDCRFREDALRILRLFRFSATLGFEIEVATKAAAYNNARLLKYVSCERIAEELKKSALGDFFNPFTEFLNYGALSFCGINSANNKNLNRLPKNQFLRLFTLLNTKSNDLKIISKQLKFSRSLTDYLCNIKTLTDSKIPESRAEIKFMLRDFDIDILRDSLIYKKIVNGENTDSTLSLIDAVLKNGEAYKISHLDINGEDIKLCGINGTQIGETLSNLLDAVIKDPSLNQKEILKNLFNK